MGALAIAIMAILLIAAWISQDRPFSRKRTRHEGAHPNH